MQGKQSLCSSETPTVRSWVYSSEMVNRGMLKKEGERGGAKYSI